MTNDPFADKSTQDVDAYLSGGGAVTAKFPTTGTDYEGIVIAKVMQHQRDYDEPNFGLYWVDGKKRKFREDAVPPGAKPVMMAVVTLQTAARGTFDKDGNPQDVPNDNGVRALYVRGAMQKSIRDAVRTSGAPTLELFGKLRILHSALGKQDNPKYNPPKLFEAVFTPASKVAKNDPLLLLALGEGDLSEDDPFAG